MGGVKELGSKMFYFYSWKITRVVLVILAAILLTPLDFGKIYLPLITISFFMHFFEFNVKDEEVHKFCSTVSLIAPIVGMLIALLFLSISVFIPELSDSLKLSAAMAMFLGLKRTAELYYKNKDMFTKVYKIYFAAETTGLVLSLVLFSFGYGYISFLIGYLAFHVIGAFAIWWKFPIKVTAKVDKNVIKHMFTSWETRLPDNLLSSIYRNGLLIIVSIVFGLKEFAYLYLAFILGYFSYKNITTFITESLLKSFAKMNEEVFRYNLIKLTEYITLITLPIPIVLITLSPEIAYFLGWQEYFIIPFIAFAGMLKAVFETSRITFLIKRQEWITKIKMVEISSLAFFSAVFGYFFGLNGIAFAILISSIIGCFLYYYASKKLIKANVYMISRDYFFIMLSGVFFGLTVAMLKEFFFLNYIALITITCLGLLIYFLITVTFNKELYKRCVRFIFETFEK